MTLVALPPSLHDTDPDYARERYDPLQAAAYLGVDRSTVYAEVRTGRLSHRRDGVRGRISMSQRDLDEWRQARRHDVSALPTSTRGPVSKHAVTLPAVPRRRFAS